MTTKILGKKENLPDSDSACFGLNKCLSTIWHEHLKWAESKDTEQRLGSYGGLFCWWTQKPVVTLGRGKEGMKRKPIGRRDLVSSYGSIMGRGKYRLLQRRPAPPPVVPPPVFLLVSHPHKMSHPPHSYWNQKPGGHSKQFHFHPSHPLQVLAMSPPKPLSNLSTSQIHCCHITPQPPASVFGTTTKAS